MEKNAARKKKDIVNRNQIMVPMLHTDKRYFKTMGTTPQNTPAVSAIRTPKLWLDFIYPSQGTATCQLFSFYLSFGPATINFHDVAGHKGCCIGQQPDHRFGYL